jgi:hypothetical protein
MGSLDESRDSHEDLCLQVYLEGLARTDGEAGPVATFRGTDTVRFPQKDWLDALIATGYGSTLVVEIVVPTTEGDPGRLKAIEEMNRAVKKLRQVGNEHDAVAACRPALEAFGVQAGRPQSVALTYPKEKSKDDQSFEERLALLSYALREMTHLGHHEGGIRCSKAEAQLVTRLTAARLAYAFRDKS